MTTSQAIVGYQYNVEILCPTCTIVALQGDHADREGAQQANAENVLNFVAAIMEIDRMDESSFDSSRFPKVVLRYQATSWVNDDGSIIVDECAHCGEDLVQL